MDARSNIPEENCSTDNKFFTLITDMVIKL
jgi:hypothetical protein